MTPLGGARRFKSKTTVLDAKRWFLLSGGRFEQFPYFSPEHLVRLSFLKPARDAMFTL
ncbi:MAG TPA: hypothetical protein V6C97_34760 [Oculatellaceae cyanobacterium]